MKDKIYENLYLFAEDDVQLKFPYIYKRKYLR